MPVVKTHPTRLLYPAGLLRVFVYPDHSANLYGSTACQRLCSWPIANWVLQIPLYLGRPQLQMDCGIGQDRLHARYA